MSDLEIIDEVKASSSVCEGDDSSSVPEARDPVPTSGHIEANPLHDGGDSDTNQGELNADGERPKRVRKPKEEVWIEKNISSIGNKVRRNEAWVKLKREKKREKRKRQDERKKEREELGDEAPPKLVPKTLDNMREYDVTTVGGKTGEEEDEEVEHDIVNDEFSEYFNKSYEPKVLVTSCDNPHTRSIAFIKELTRIIPNAEPRWRKNASIKKMVKDAISKGYTDIVLVNEDNRSPNGLVVTHLPDGPTASFRLSNVKVTKDLRKDYHKITAHRPEVILNNFSTRLGHGVARMLAALFHYEPQFTGKRVVTLHNQRDYIFFRHHNYTIKSSDKVRLHELGPRFTLKLKSMQTGTFDSKSGDYEWMITDKRHDMETSRKKFFL